MDLQVGVKVLIKNKSKYLLQRRSKIKYPHAQIGWDIIGGRIIPGIPLIENLKREVKEEIAMTLLKVDKILGVQDILRVKNKHVVRITYLGSAKGKIKLDKEENTEYKWFSLGEMKKLSKKEMDMYFYEVLTDLK